MSNDPNTVTDAIQRATDAFEFRGRGAIDPEAGIERNSEWETQLTKSCRYLEACRALRRTDGYHGAVVELCFGAIERTLEVYALWDTDDTLTDFHDHEAVYDRVTERGLFDSETADSLRELYRANRTEHYYGSAVPTAEKATAMYELAERVHEYVVDQFQAPVCRC